MGTDLLASLGSKGRNGNSLASQKCRFPFRADVQYKERHQKKGICGTLCAMTTAGAAVQYWMAGMSPHEVGDLESSVEDEEPDHEPCEEVPASCDSRTDCRSQHCHASVLDPVPGDVTRLTTLTGRCHPGRFQC